MPIRAIYRQPTCVMVSARSSVRPHPTAASPTRCARRIVNYTRDTVGRITGVTTKKNATAAVVTLASGIAYQPMSRLLFSLALF